MTGEKYKYRRRTFIKTLKIPDREEINRLYDEAKESGELKNPRENVLKFSTVHKDVIHFNTTRIVGETSLDSLPMTKAEIERRRQVNDMVLFLKKTSEALRTVI